MFQHCNLYVFAFKNTETSVCCDDRYIDSMHNDLLSCLTGALVYELVSGTPLFSVGNNLGSYQAKLASLHVMDLTGIPAPLQPTLKAMMNPQPSPSDNKCPICGTIFATAKGCNTHLATKRVCKNLWRKGKLPELFNHNDLELDSLSLEYETDPPPSLPPDPDAMVCYSRIRPHHARGGPGRPPPR